MSNTEYTIGYELNNDEAVPVIKLNNSADGFFRYNNTYLTQNSAIHKTTAQVPSSPGYVLTQTVEERNVWFSGVNVSQLHPVFLSVDKNKCIYIQQENEEFLMEVVGLNGEINNVGIFPGSSQYFKLFYFDGTTKIPITRIPLELYDYIKVFGGVAVFMHFTYSIEYTTINNLNISYHWASDNKVIMPIHEQPDQRSYFKFNWNKIFIQNSQYQSEQFNIKFSEINIVVNSSEVHLERLRVFDSPTKGLVQSSGLMYDHPTYNVTEGDNQYGFNVFSVLYGEEKIRSN